MLNNKELRIIADGYDIGNIYRYKMIIDNCLLFWWFYAQMNKKLDKRYVLMLHTVRTTENLIKHLK